MDPQTAKTLGTSLAVFSLGFLYLRVALEIRRASRSHRQEAR